ncbi:MAG: hypothetical protein KGL18_01520 [Burkholderiales bacterium]|nr:hypothetical protein [Burkholderiales bacterium]MDE1928630.1 hypothetical protein [Burkholderiales bacterium]MDE2160861.1 hypothetical protein [Burkholderiales bacterium]MDE2501644.1 hypothetical protein [Burkholderiales bacterium]
MFFRARPENRQRSSETSLAWRDTVPTCFRSEAFAEDLAVECVEPPRERGVGAAHWLWRDTLADGSRLR